MLARKAQLERARAHIERLAEKWEPVFRNKGASQHERLAEKWEPVFHNKGASQHERLAQEQTEAAARPLTLMQGALHEIRVEDWRDRPAALSFALALSGRRPHGAIVTLQLAHETRETGALFARGLAALGVDPRRVVAAFARDEKRLLWALEEAAREKSVAAAIALTPKAGRLLDLTATRRLALAAEASGAAPILVRSLATPAPSAAFIRWRIEAAPSLGAPDDPRAPGRARWRVFLERCRTDGRLCGGAPFIVELCHDGERLQLAEVPSVPVSRLPLLGDGPVQARIREPGGGARCGA